MTDTSTAAVTRLLENVTPGPWEAGEHRWPDQVGCCPLVGQPFSAHQNMRNVAAANTKADIQFIAAARDLVPALLAERYAALAEVARLSHALAAETAKREADTDLLFDAYKGLLVLFRVLDKAGLTAGADTTNALANAIVAKHPEFPARTALRATLAKHGSK